MDTVNVCIKMTPGSPPRPATTKVFLPEAPGKICRPLEPGEVVALPAPLAREMLAHLKYELEMTLEPPTRPMYFNDQRTADITSLDYKPSVAGRADSVAAQVAAEREQLAKALAEAKANAPQADDEPAPDNDMITAAMDVLRRAGITPPTITPTPDPVGDLEDVDDDYTPTLNAVPTAEIEAERIKAREEALKEGRTDDAAAIVVKTDDDVSSVAPPPPTRRKRA